MCQTSRAPPPDIDVVQARPSFHCRSHPLSPFFSLIFGRCLPCVRRAGRPHPPPLEEHSAAAGCRGVRSGPVCPRRPPSACMRRRPPSPRDDDDWVVAACSFATKSTIIGVKSSFTTVESSFRATESSFLAAKSASAAVDSRRAATGSSCRATQEESVVDRAGDGEGGCGAGGDDDSGHGPQRYHSGSARALSLLPMRPCRALAIAREADAGEAREAVGGGRAWRDPDRRRLVETASTARCRVSVLSLGERDAGVARPSDAEPVDCDTRGLFRKNAAL